MSEAIITLITASTLLLGSPGPATLGLAAVGAVFGVKQGLRFLAGILTGLGAAIFGASLGLAALFAAFPGARITVQIIGGLYICYIAYKVATAPHAVDSATVSQSRPGFADGFFVNLLNPKAYAVLLALFSQFLLPLTSPSGAYILTALVCFAVGIVVDVIWLGFGSMLRPLFKQPRPARILRVLFAVLMVASVIWAYAQ